MRQGKYQTGQQKFSQKCALVVAGAGDAPPLDGGGDGGGIDMRPIVALFLRPAAMQNDAHGDEQTTHQILEPINKHGVASAPCP